MDLQGLSTLFAATLNPDPNAQKAAELEIRKVGQQEGMIAALLQIIATESADLATRQACSVYLKNRVYTSYDIDPSTTRTRADQVPIPASDRDALRSHILPLIAAASTKPIQNQLAVTLKNMVQRDFPERWPGLLDDVKRMLGSTNVREVEAGCVASLECVRAFRFRQEDKLIASVVEALFPPLVSIAQQLLSTPPPGTEQQIPYLLHLILKSYKTSTMVRLTPHQQSAPSLVPWGKLLFQVITLQIPADAVPADEEERERSEWWKAKKWAYGILGRLFHRYGNPSQLPSVMKADYGGFADHFIAAFAPEIFKMYISQVELYISGQSWLSNKCQYQIFTFFTECVKTKSTWLLVKPHFETLVSRFVFPQLCFNASKQEMWEADPAEYVRTSVDEYENYVSPTSSATTFLITLVSSRTKATFMPILNFVNSVLQSSTSTSERFGALNMTAALGPFILQHPQARGDMERFLGQYVLPAFTAGEGYLRAIACEVVGTVEKNKMEWQSEENLSQYFGAVAVALDDQELPVRVQGGLALAEMVRRHESIRTAVAPQVGKVITGLLKMADETDLDILNHAMETMVDNFADELLPVAAQLTARLCDTYMRLAREAMAHDLTSTPGVEELSTLLDQDTDDDKTYAAMGIAKTIGNVLAAVEDKPEVFDQVHEVVVPIIVFTLENKMLDLFDNVYDLVDVLTFRLRAIRPSMWPVFELTYKLFKTDAIDFLDEMLPALDNFISYGSEVVKNRPDYKEMCLDIYVTAMSSEQLGENDRVNGCKLVEAMLLNLRGHIDEALQTIIKTAMDHLDTSETYALTLCNLEVLINTVLYNPSAALQLMETYRAGASRVFFDRWFAIINEGEKKLPRVHDKKLCIVALCALLEMDASAIPAPLHEGWPHIVSGLLKVFVDLPRAVAARQELEQELQEEDDDEETDIKILSLDDEGDEDVYDEDTAYLEMLAKEGARLRERTEKLESGDDESDVSDESDLQEEIGYTSPLDQIDPYVAFHKSMTVFQNQSGQLYQAATTSLNMDQQTQLMEIIATGRSHANL